MENGYKYEFKINDPEIEEMFLRCVGSERTTVSNVVNVAIILFLSYQIDLKEEEKLLLIKQAIDYRKQYQNI